MEEALKRDIKRELSDSSSHGLSVAAVIGLSEAECDATYTQACLDLQGGNLAAAARTFGLSCLLDHHRGRSFQGLGLCLYKMGHYGSAAQIYQRALLLDPDDIVTRVLWAEALVKTRRPSRAREECKRAIEDGRRLGKPEHGAYVKRAEKLLAFILTMQENA